MGTRPVPGSLSAIPSIENLADPIEGRALHVLGAGRYDSGMANETGHPLLTRCEWLQALGAGMVVPGCAVGARSVGATERLIEEIQRAL